MFKNKEDSNKVLDKHKSLILQNLTLKYEPLVLDKKRTHQFLKKVKIHKRMKKLIKEGNGFFMYTDIPEEYEKYRESGIVFIRKNNVGTLAHELYHAKQYQERDEWFELLKDMYENKSKEKCYKLFYYYIPPENEAFTYAKQYLRTTNLSFTAKKYEQHVIRIKRRTDKKLFCFLYRKFLSWVLKDIYIKLKKRTAMGEKDE